MLPYGNIWRESRRIFTKHFSNSNINQPRDILYVKRFLGQLLRKPNDFLQHARTYGPFTVTLVNRCLFCAHSLVLQVPPYCR